MSSVPKSKKKPSKLEVFHYWNKLRLEISDLLLRDFGFSKDKANKKISRQFKGKDYDELSEDEQIRYDKIKKRNDAFAEWFILNEREAIVDYIRNVGRCLYSANSIYPQYWSELEQRRLFQEEALGYCESLIQELQYAIDILPVDINKYTRFSDMIEHEIELIKGWRKSDNRFKSIVKNELKDEMQELRAGIQDLRQLIVETNKS